MPRSFQSEAYVGACDNYGLAFEVVRWVRKRGVLRLDEGSQEVCRSGGRLADVADRGVDLQAEHEWIPHFAR